MATIRKDVLNRSDEVDISALDKNVKNSWRWAWLEKEVKGVYLRDVIRKLRSSGKAYCIICSKELLYGSRGFKALVSHMESRKHCAAVEQRQNSVAFPGK